MDQPDALRSRRNGFDHMKDVDLGVMSLGRVDGVTEGIGGVFTQVCGVKDIFDSRNHGISPQSLFSQHGIGQPDDDIRKDGAEEDTDGL